jgi:rhodanese-related sulfurtransferase
VADDNQAAQLFLDPRREQGLIVFIDARDDEHFQEGHIPGAYQLDYYHAENYLGTVLPVCQLAQQIIVYCNGGECEASEHTAEFLRDAQVPADKLYVYAGGITAWNAKHRPVELGARNSGQMRVPNDAR